MNTFFRPLDRQFLIKFPLILNRFRLTNLIAVPQVKLEQNITEGQTPADKIIFLEKYRGLIQQFTRMKCSRAW